MYVFDSSTGSHVFFPIIIMPFLLIITQWALSMWHIPTPGKMFWLCLKRVLAVFHWSRVWLFTWTLGTLPLTLPVSMNKPIKRIFMFACAAECQKMGWNIWRRRVPPLLLSTMLLLVPVQEIRIPVLKKSSAQLYICLFSISKVVSAQQKHA